jgi:hypothetical protein
MEVDSLLNLSQWIVRKSIMISLDPMRLFRQKPWMTAACSAGLGLFFVAVGFGATRGKPKRVLILESHGRYMAP